jgi:hypothetical protein
VIWTNKQNLPEPIYNAIVNSDYSKGHADFSVTELGMPPQERRLFKDNHHLITKDIIDNIWALFGTSMHYILEKASGTSDTKRAKFMQEQLSEIRDAFQTINHGQDGRSPIQVVDELEKKVDEILGRQMLIEHAHLSTEDRMFVRIANYIIGGQPDLYNTETMIIQDYKVTTVWKYMQKDKSQWETQLNSYRYLLTHNDRPVKGLQVVGIFKDWKAYDMYKENYPPSPVMVIDIPVQNDLYVLEYITKRLRMHEEVKGEAYSDPEKLFAKSPCSDSDMWASKEFKVYKRGGKRSSKNCDNLAEAVAWVNGRTNEYSVVDKSTHKKCDEYCDVKDFCAQNKKRLAQIAGDETNITSAPTVNIPAEIPVQKKGELSDFQKQLLKDIVPIANAERGAVNSVAPKVEEVPIKDFSGKEIEKPMSALERVRARNAEKLKIIEAKEVEVEPIEIVEETIKMVDETIALIDETTDLIDKVVEVETPKEKPEVSKDEIGDMNDILNDLDLNG